MTMKNKKEYVDVEIEISDEDFLNIAKMAHEKDITINQMMNQILEKYMRKDIEKNG